MNLQEQISRIKNMMGVLNEKSILNEKLILGSKERIHISHSPITEIKDYSNIQNHPNKPSGLWYGFGNEWIWFSKTDMGDEYWNDMKYAYKIKINPKTILSIKTKNELDKLIDKYYVDGSMDWLAVKKDYSGVEFPTYFSEEFRNLWRKTGKDKYEWVYLVDVPSGCVWRPDGVLSIKSFGERTISI